MGSDTSPALIADYYDTWTERYIEAFGDAIQAHRPTEATDLFDYLMRRAGLRDGKKALDAGCGICGPSRHFAAKASLSIEALTLSSVQVETAQQKIAEEGLDGRIHVHQGDYHDANQIYPRESFDVVFFLESLSHSRRPREALAAAYEVLKPGGIVYIKDYFIRPCDDPEEQERVLEVVERVDLYFATATAWSHDIVRHLEELGFLKLFVEPPQFEVDNRPWQRFERDNEIDLFDGAESFHWSHWLELKYQKP